MDQVDRRLPIRLHSPAKKGKTQMGERLVLPLEKALVKTQTLWLTPPWVLPRKLSVPFQIRTHFYCLWLLHGQVELASFTQYWHHCNHLQPNKCIQRCKYMLSGTKKTFSVMPRIGPFWELLKTISWSLTFYLFLNTFKSTLTGTYKKDTIPAL